MTRYIPENYKRMALNEIFGFGKKPSNYRATDFSDGDEFKQNHKNDDEYNEFVDSAYNQFVNNELDTLNNLKTSDIFHNVTDQWKKNLNRNHQKQNFERIYCPTCDDNKYVNGKPCPTCVNSAKDFIYPQTDRLRFWKHKTEPDTYAVDSDSLHDSQYSLDSERMDKVKNALGGAKVKALRDYDYEPGQKEKEDIIGIFKSMKQDYEEDKIDHLRGYESDFDSEKEEMLNKINKTAKKIKHAEKFFKEQYNRQLINEIFGFGKKRSNYRATDFDQNADNYKEFIDSAYNKIKNIEEPYHRYGEDEYLAKKSSLEPFACPTCHGLDRVPNKRTGQLEDCPTCNLHGGNTDVKFYRDKNNPKNIFIEPLDEPKPYKELHDMAKAKRDAESDYVDDFDWEDYMDMDFVNRNNTNKWFSRFNPKWGWEDKTTQKAINMQNKFKDVTQDALKKKFGDDINVSSIHDNHDFDADFEHKEKIVDNTIKHTQRWKRPDQYGDESKEKWNKYHQAANEIKSAKHADTFLPSRGGFPNKSIPLGGRKKLYDDYD